MVARGRCNDCVGACRGAASSYCIVLELEVRVLGGDGVSGGLGELGAHLNAKGELDVMGPGAAAVVSLAFNAVVGYGSY